MAIKTDTFTGGGGGGGGAVDSVNGDTGVVVVTLDGVTDQNASTTNAITVGGVTIGTEYSLPTTDGASGQALTTNGTGTLSFTNITSDVTSVNTQTGAVTLSANDLAADHTASNYTASNANIDGHLSGIDTKLGTLTAGLTYQGSYNANTNSPSLANAEQGDLYIVSVAGTQFGETWAVGDHLLVNADMGGVIDNSKIDKIDNTDQVTSVNTQTGAVVLSANDLAADHTAVNYTAANANIDGHLSGIDSKLASQLESGDNISLLNNNSGFISDITGESLNDLSDVSFTAGAGIDNYVLKYDNGTSSWGAEAESTAAAASETVAGVIEIATNAEASAGTATDKALVPSNVSSLDLSAMDNTTSAFISDITSESLNDLSDVSFTAGAGIDNYVLTYDNATTSWGAELVPSAPVTSVNTFTGAVVVSGDDIAADHTAVNYTAANANVDGHLSGVDTKLGTLLSDITGESLNDLSDVSFTAGAGIDNYVLTYDNGTSSWGAEAAPTAAAASETVAGVIEIATNAEASAATATDKALVPSNVPSLDLSAMDNTTSAFISGITSESLNNLSDVSFTAGAGIDNYILTYDHATTSWGAEAAAAGGYSISSVGSSDIVHPNYAVDNTFYYVDTSSGTTTTISLPGGSSPAEGRRIKFFNHGDGLLKVQEQSGTARIHPDDSGADPGGSGTSYKLIGSRCVIEFIGIPSSNTWEWAISSQLELGKDTLSNDGDVLRYDSATDQMVALPYTFPTADGTSGQVLKTDGSGVLSFVDQASGGGWTYSAITADPANAQAGYHYSCTGTFTITLPTSGVSAGEEIRVKNMGTGTITIDPQTQNIDGSTTDYTLDVQYSAITLVSTGAHWEII